MWTGRRKEYLIKKCYIEILFMMFEFTNSKINLKLESNKKIGKKEREKIATFPMDIKMLLIL